MKGTCLKTLTFAAAVALAGSSPASAATEFWDMLPPNFSTTIVGTDVYNQALSTSLNQATVRAVWFENVANGGQFGVFDSVDTLIGTLDIYDRNGVLVLQSPAGLTRPGVDAWAAQNARAIFAVLFPAGIGEVTGATDDSILAGATVSKNLFEKAAPARKDQTVNAVAAKNEVGDASAEYQRMQVNHYRSRAVSMVVGFSKASGAGLEYSLILPYRATEIHDDLGSKSSFLGMEMAAKYPVGKWGGNQVKVGGCLFGSAFELKTDKLDKSGNLKYGGGIFTSVDHELGFGTIGVGLDYRLAKAYMPDSMNSDSLFFEQAADYVNKHSPIQTVSYGCNLGLPLLEGAGAANFEVIRSNFIGDDIPEGQKAKTSVNLGFSFYPGDTFELNLGIGRDFEFDGVDSMGIKLGMINRF